MVTPAGRVRVRAPLRGLWMVRTVVPPLLTEVEVMVPPTQS